MRMLAGERHNVCAVGDEDQSIYSWRGADIRNILEFEQDFPKAKIVRLEQNYRSTQNILQGASAVVANNVRRKGKNLWTARQGGTKIGYYEAPDGENEALFAADHVAKYLREAAGQADPRAAVLYRTNSQSRLFEEAMRRYGLKYKVVGGFSFYELQAAPDLARSAGRATGPARTAWRCSPRRRSRPPRRCRRRWDARWPRPAAPRAAPSCAAAPPRAARCAESSAPPAAAEACRWPGRRRRCRRRPVGGESRNVRSSYAPSLPQVYPAGHHDKNRLKVRCPLTFASRDGIC